MSELNQPNEPEVSGEPGKPSFGPFFPSPLQLAIHHADRVALALEEAEAQRVGGRWSDAAEASEEQVWLLGRAEEVRAFVGDLVEDWRRGAVSTEEAALTLDRHLMELHDGMKRYLWLAAPPCCSDGAETLDVRARTHSGREGVTPVTASIAAVTVVPR